MNYQFATSINQLLKIKHKSLYSTLTLMYHDTLMIHYYLIQKNYLILQNKITPHDVSLSVPFEAEAPLKSA